MRRNGTRHVPACVVQFVLRAVGYPMNLASLFLTFPTENSYCVLPLHEQQITEKPNDKTTAASKDTWTGRVRVRLEIPFSRGESENRRYICILVSQIV